MASQPLEAPLTKAATFLVFSVNDASQGAPRIRSTLASIGDLAKNVSSRDPSARLTCVIGIGASIWSKLTNLSPPAELRSFQEVQGGKHTAISTPGDLLFHIRSERRDLNFEFERQLMNLLGNTVTLQDQTLGFKYFDSRDLLGFVDGTANPVGQDIAEVIRITKDNNPVALGGSYIVVQKYLHDMEAWNALSTEQQEAIIGRTKLDNVELDDAEDGQQQSHKSLATIEDDDGNEYAIVRDNMAFGSPASGVFGTYFIGYSNRLWVLERMLQRMFIGCPPGKHDRILDFSKPVTGSVFFAPSILPNSLQGPG